MPDDPAAVHDLIPTTARIGTWNLWWRFGPWQDRLPLVIDEIRRVDPDVLALQEVWAAGGTDAASEIAAALDFDVVTHTAVELEPGVGFGNAVVSRWPITGHESHELATKPGKDERRHVLRADIDGPRGPLQVFSTHLNWRIDQSDVRQLQVADLAAFVDRSPERTFPAVLCGDLNAEPHSDEVLMLTGQRAVPVDGLVFVDTWHSCHPTDPGFTFDNENPYVASQLEWNRRLDYVLVGWPKARGAGNPVRSERFGLEPTGGVWPSDHYGVVSEVRY